MDFLVEKRASRRVLRYTSLYAELYLYLTKAARKVAVNFIYFFNKFSEELRLGVSLYSTRRAVADKRSSAERLFSPNVKKTRKFGKIFLVRFLSLVTILR